MIIAHLFLYLPQIVNTCKQLYMYINFKTRNIYIKKGNNVCLARSKKPFIVLQTHLYSEHLSVQASLCKLCVFNKTYEMLCGIKRRN